MVMNVHPSIFYKDFYETGIDPKHNTYNWLPDFRRKTQLNTSVGASHVGIILQLKVSSIYAVKNNAQECSKDY